MTSLSLLPVLLGFLMGAIGGAAIAILLKAGKGQRELLDATGQLSAAQAAAQLEKSRREELEAQLEEARSGLTELGSQVAVAQEREVKAEQLIAELKQFSEQSKLELENRFKALAAEDPRIGDVRGPGLMIGVEMVKDPDAAPDNTLGSTLSASCAEKGLLVLTCGAGNVVRWIPPLDVERAEIEEALGIFQESLLATR